MSRTTARPTVLAVALTATLFAAGCSTTVTGTAAPVGAAASAGPGAPAAPTGGGDAVAWVDKVCGSLLPFATAVTSEPQLNSSDPAETIKGLSDFLGRTVGTLDTTLSGLKAAGPSPVAGGDEVVSKLSDTLTKIRTSFQTSKTQIDAVDPNNLEALAGALPAALAPLQDLSGLADPAADLKSSPELDKAAAQAPNCKKLN